MKNIFMLIILTLLILPVVFAIQEDYSLNVAKLSNDICAGQIIENQLIILNTGITTSKYYITLGGNGAQFVAIAKELMVLEPGQSESIPLFYNPSINAKGEYNLKITVTTDFDTIKEYNLKFTVNDCNNVDLEIPQDAYQNDPCTPTLYKFTVYNTGVFADTYNFQVEGFASDEVAFSVPSAYIQKGDKQDIIMYITPKCEKYGTKKGILTVKSSTKQVSRSFILDIRQKYDYTITPGIYQTKRVSQFHPEVNITTHEIIKTPDYPHNNYMICKDLMYRIPIKLENQMHFGNKYTITAAEKVSATSVYVPANDNKFFELQLFPDTVGNYTVNVTAESVRGNIVKSTIIDYTVEDCFNFDMKVNLEENTCEMYNTFDIDFTNKGSRDYTIVLKSNVDLETHAFSLTDNTTIKGTLPKNISEVIINAEVKDFSKFSKNFTKQITIHPDEDCFKLDVDKNKLTVFYEEATKQITFKNIGVKPADFVIVANFPDWAKFNQSTISLEPNEKKSLDLYLTPDWDQESKIHNVTLNFIVPNANMTFTHDMQIELRDRTDIEWIFNWINVNKLWIVLFLIILFIIIGLIILMQSLQPPKRQERKKLIIKKSKIAKPKKIKPKKEKDKTEWWRIIATIILLLIVFAAIYFIVTSDYFFPQNVANETVTTTTIMSNVTHNDTVTTGDNAVNRVTKWFNSLFATTTSTNTTTSTVDINTLQISEVVALAQESEDENILLNYLYETGQFNEVLFQVWESNTDHNFNLNDHFHDPDEDIVSFTFSETKHITVTEQDGLVTFTPEKDWHGIEEIIFTAEDNKGGQTQSPSIYLIVTKPELSNVIFQFAKTYVWWIINGFLLLILVILILLPKEKK